MFSCGTENQTSTNAEEANTNSEQALADDIQSAEVTPAPVNNSLKSISEQAASTADLSEFSQAFRKSGLAESLNSTGPYTVFMPSNEAFDALPGDTFDDLLKPENKQQLADILNNHIVAGKLDTATLQDGSTIKTLGNEQLEVSKKDDLVMINGAEVRKANIQSSNGVIHMIDKVLMPEQN